MINSAEIVKNLVDKLRLIPELVNQQMEGNADAIFAYHDRYPEQTRIRKAIHEMESPSIMVAAQGVVPGTFGISEVWRHQISLFLRISEQLTGDPPKSYGHLTRLIYKGVPTGETLSLGYLTIHASCHPMDLLSAIRQSDEEESDYFEVQTSFMEMGDD